MARGEKARKRLKNLLRVQSRDDGRSSLREQYETESDRAVIILAASDLEDILRSKLQDSMRNLNSDLRASIFGVDRPLGSFSSMIDVSYAFGVIDKDAHSVLHVLREMRNACAHSLTQLTFETPEIVELTVIIREFTSEIFKSGEEPVADPSIGREALRYTFLFGCMMLAVAVSMGTPKASKIAPEVIKSLLRDLGDA